MDLECVIKAWGEGTGLRVDILNRVNMGRGIELESVGKGEELGKGT